MKTHYPFLLSVTLLTAPFSLRAQSTATPLTTETAPVATTPALPTSEYTPTPSTPTTPSSPLANLPPPTPGAPDPAVGDPINSVFVALGRPNGVITNPDKSVLLIYERGTIVVADGKVTEVKLMSLANYNAKLAAADASEAERKAANARANALLQMLMADPGYQSMTTYDRMLTLTKFDREHPGSEAKKFQEDLKAIYSVEQSMKAHVQELQAQVNQANSKTALLEQRVLDANRNADNLKETAAFLKAQADAAREQTPQINLGAPPAKSLLLTTPNSGPASNTPGSKAGPGGGMVLSPTKPVNPMAPAAKPSVIIAPDAKPPTGMKYILAPDGVTVLTVPETTAPTPGS